MNYESNGTMLLDEIERIFVVYTKAKEYINKILFGVNQQIDLWQYRRQIILEQSSSTSTFDFLLPKTQRINELSIDAVQALCRVDLIIDQILRIDPKASATVSKLSVPKTTSFSERSFDTTIPNTASNSYFPRVRHATPLSSFRNMNEQQPYTEDVSNGSSSIPVPVLRSSQTTLSNRAKSAVVSTEKSGFKPIEQQQSPIISESTRRPKPMHPQNVHSPAPAPLNLGRPVLSSHTERTPQVDDAVSPLVTKQMSQIMSNYRKSPDEKVEVKLQRIPPGTRWKNAKIDVVDTLSAFYVENCEPKVQEKFNRMSNDLHNYYNELDELNKLVPLKNIAIGDFGVAKFGEDNRWYRARILSYEAQDCIRIIYIDYGNVESKLINEFFPLEKLYTDLPAQAIGCSLSEAYPRTISNEDSIWPEETIQVFRDEVMQRNVEVVFVKPEETTTDWPLHFVRIIVGNQSVTNSLNLKQRIEPRPNSFIAEKLSNNIDQQIFILFNVSIFTDEEE